jgi:RNA polymerase sigma-70 factor (ECF subfamily)
MDSSDFFNNSDREIIGQFCQGGIERRRSEEQLFNRFAYFIREGMRKHALSEDEAFDAYSDTILAAIENIKNSGFEGRSSLKTYLSRIFNNKCVDLFRKKTTNKNSVNRSETISERLMSLSDMAKSALQKLIDKTDRTQLRERLNDLEERCRQLLLYWSDNYNDKEIAALLNYKTADVVKTSRLRCLEKLRKAYNIS